MNVLYIATYEGLSGASYSLIGMIKELRKIGINPLVVLLKDGKLRPKLEENNIPYIIIRGYPWVIAENKRNNLKNKVFWMIKRIINCIADRKISKVIRYNKIDIVHINAFTASVGLKAAHKNNIPCIWHIREFVEEDLKKVFWNKNRAIKYLATADQSIAISKSVYEKFKKQSPSSNIKVVYNGVLNKDYQEARKNKIFEETPIKILISGRIDPGKGHEELIDALQQLVAKGVNVRLRVAGVSQSKEYEAYIKKKVNNLNLEQNITFLGFRNDLPDLYKDSDITVVASKAEAFGRVTVEAMMAGSLVIGADTAGTKELIQQDYGLLYKQGDSTDLVNKILYALEHKDEMRIIANTARNYALQYYTAERNAQEIFELYEMVMKNSHNNK